MNVVVDRVKEWARAAKARAQAVELEQKTRELKLYDLPTFLTTWLNQEIRQLAPHPAYVQTVTKKLSSAIKQWQGSESGHNHLVILGSPAERISEIMHTGLRTWQQQNTDVIESLNIKPIPISWTGRPFKYRQIESKLLAEIDAARGDQPIYTEVEISRKPQPLIMIPSLSWCFLRSLGGLEAIQLLLDIISQDRTSFWLIGCNFWAWRYLDQVFQISAYFEQTQHLPKLDRAAIRQLLEPVDAKIEFNPQESQIYFKPKQSPLSTDNSDQNSEDWVSRSQKLYFNSLLNISTGLPQVAGKAWLRSLKYDLDHTKQSEMPTEENLNQAKRKAIVNGQSNNGTNPADDAQNDADLVIEQIDNEEICGETLSHIRRTRPTLPSLPKLSADNRYLLFSLVLHEEISLTHLATSLGDEQGEVRAQVQKLSGAGMLEDNHGIISLNPAYYAALKNDLANNNFLIWEGN
ncbi:hypothetical protein Pse7367_0569 [Thalassoporum mexicanum PCC 7367]|uniref:hypothetical protein n=1 Tax=Thalassoporum mexicanum TaxID=3457544 RepID=UPI00029FE600|nr:hypothetical protein [Pseudanabaena sp. PCC 7367]AFY68874.1 hypothetical protein Pse7367_0569 [Pseudanabaena sp. PCC 7367]